MVNNNTPVSYECKTNPEPKLLADVNVADMMRATLDVLMITRGNTFCDLIESLPYSELITGREEKND